MALGRLGLRSRWQEAHWALARQAQGVLKWRREGRTRTEQRGTRGGLGCQRQDSGLRLSREGPAHLDRQHADGLCLPQGDGLRRQHSDRDPIWRGRKVRPAPLPLSGCLHPCDGAKSMDSGIKSTWALVRPWPVTGSLTLARLLNHYGPHSSPLENGDKNSDLTGLLRSRDKVTQIKCPSEGLALKRSSMMVIFSVLGPSRPLLGRRHSLLTRLPRLHGDFRRDLLKNSLWGYSLEEPSDLWGRLGTKEGFILSPRFPTCTTLFRQQTKILLHATAL